MALAALLNINVALLLAQRRFKLLLTVIGCAGLYLGSVVLLCSSVYGVMYAAGLMNLAAWGITTLGIFKSSVQEEGAEV
jgi:hypothetical protein